MQSDILQADEAVRLVLNRPETPQIASLQPCGMYATTRRLLSTPARSRGMRPHTAHVHAGLGHVGLETRGSLRIPSLPAAFDNKIAQQ